MSHRVPAAPLALEIPKIKGSRFLAHVAPVADADAALAHVQAVRKEHHSSRHVCWAYRLGDEGGETRSSDDGEPSGSAGKPILAAIEGADLTWVCVTVTRWFGGTKLGVGGLVRAYGGAAAAALAEVEVVVVVPTTTVVVQAPYELMGTLEAFVAREGLTPAAADYAAEVTLRFEVPVADAPPLADRLREASHGRLQAELDPD